jgi:hypothetical protein
MFYGAFMVAEAAIAKAGTIPWRRFTVISTAIAAAYVLVLGTATAVIPNPIFHRVIATDVGNILSLLGPAALFGPLMATYLVPWPVVCRVGGRATTGGILSFLAVGCPVCNKLVVLAIGVTGATDYFHPLQPLLGAISLVLLGVALWLRFRARATSGPGRTGR